MILTKGDLCTYLQMGYTVVEHAGADIERQLIVPGPAHVAGHLPGAFARMRATADVAFF